MSFHFSGLLSGLAYLAFCLLVAASRAGKKYRRDASTIGQDGGESPALPSVSCLISLFSFLFLPCGALPSLFPVSGGALLAAGGLALALGFRGWNAPRRQWWIPFCLGVSLTVIARYAQQRGVPGDLFTLDAYVAMPVFGAAEGAGKPGVGVLAAASLLALCPASNGKPSGETLPDALAAELWMLLALGFWVGLFFPFSFAFESWPEISSLTVALNALLFWCKVLGLAWLLEKQREKFPRGMPFHGAIVFALSGLGAWLLLGVAAE